MNVNRGVARAASGVPGGGGGGGGPVPPPPPPHPL